MSDLVNGFCEDVKKCIPNDGFKFPAKKRKTMQPGTYKKVSKGGVVIGFIYLTRRTYMYEAHKRDSADVACVGSFGSERMARSYITGE